MYKLYVYTDQKSNNAKLFYGQSSSGETVQTKIEVIESVDKDDLIAKAILRAPEDAYIICAYGGLKTTMSPKEILDGIEFILKEKPTLDVFYLTIYADNCSLRTDETDYKNMTFVRTLSPYGTECILITPKGVNKFLDLIQDDHGRGFDFYLNAASEKMMNYTSLPPFLKVDISMLDHEKNYVKVAECREEIISTKPIELTKKPNGNLNFFWFFVIIVTILFFATLLISVDPSTNYNINQSENTTNKTAGKPNIGSSMSPY